MSEFKYRAKISKQKGGGYLVEFPDLPGCLTEGDTRDEAKRNAKEALSGWLQTAIKHGIDIPSSSQRKLFASGIWINVDAEVAFALLVLKARKKSGLTQEQIASSLDMKQQAYRKLETPGVSNPTLKTLVRLVRELSISSNELVRVIQSASNEDEEGHTLPRTKKSRDSRSSLHC